MHVQSYNRTNYIKAPTEHIKIETLPKTLCSCVQVEVLTALNNNVRKVLNAFLTCQQLLFIAADLLLQIPTV